MSTRSRPKKVTVRLSGAKVLKLAAVTLCVDLFSTVSELKEQLFEEQHTRYPADEQIFYTKDGDTELNNAATVTSLMSVDHETGEAIPIVSLRVEPLKRMTLMHEIEITQRDLFAKGSSDDDLEMDDLHLEDTLGIDKGVVQFEDSQRRDSELDVHAAAGMVVLCSGARGSQESDYSHSSFDSEQSVDALVIADAAVSKTHNLDSDSDEDFHVMYRPGEQPIDDEDSPRKVMRMGSVVSGQPVYVYEEKSSSGSPPEADSSGAHNIGFSQVWEQEISVTHAALESRELTQYSDEDVADAMDEDMTDASDEDAAAQKRVQSMVQVDAEIEELEYLGADRVSIDGTFRNVGDEKTPELGPIRMPHAMFGDDNSTDKVPRILAVLGGDDISDDDMETPMPRSLSDAQEMSYDETMAGFALPPKRKGQSQRGRLGSGRRNLEGRSAMSVRTASTGSILAGTHRTQKSLRRSLELKREAEEWKWAVLTLGVTLAITVAVGAAFFIYRSKTSVSKQRSVMKANGKGFKRVPRPRRKTLG